MPSKKVNRVNVSDGPVLVDTTFVDDSPEGEAAWYLNQGEIAPRRGVALGISTLFRPLAAAMRGQSLEQVEELILSSERCLFDFMKQARERAQLNRRSSPENLTPNLDGPRTEEEFKDQFSNATENSPPQSLLANPSENLSNLFK
jgi:hypothetical protein